MVGTTLQTLLNNTAYAVMLSAHIPEQSDIYDNALHNAIRTTDLIDLLDATGLRYEPAIGCYKGVEEASFIVMCSDIYDVMRIECIGIHRFQQDSVLILDMDKCCALLKYASLTQMIGRGLEQVDSTDGLDAYTIVNNEIWAVV